MANAAIRAQWSPTLNVCQLPAASSEACTNYQTTFSEIGAVEWWYVPVEDVGFLTEQAGCRIPPSQSCCSSHVSVSLLCGPVLFTEHVRGGLCLLESALSALHEGGV